MKPLFRALCAAAVIMLLAAGCALALAESTLTLPAGLQIIEAEAFYGVRYAVKAELPEGVTHIESRAFADSSVEEINFPDSIVAIANDAFEGAPLKKVTANKGTVGYDWAEAHGIPVSGGITKLTWVVGTSPAPADNDLVLAALNEISRERLGVEVEIIYMSSDEAMASLRSGDPYDMYFSCSWFNNYDENAANGYFADISKSLPAIAPALYATMPESVWDLVKEKGGQLYGVPIKKDYAPMYFVVYDADIAQQAGITLPDAVSSLDELTDYLAALKSAMEQDPSLGDYPVVINGSIYGLDGDFEYIDRAAMIGVSYGDTQVHSLLDDAAVMDRYRVLHKWYEMGLVKIETGEDGQGENRGHSIRFVQAWTGYDYSPSMGYRAKMVRYAGPVLNSDGVKGGMTAFSARLANDPGKLALCLQYQELVNTDQQYRDILAYGVPGVHFNYSGRTVQRTEQRYRYAPWQFAQGSYAVKSVEAGSGSADQWTRYFALVDKAPASKLGGFALDSTDFGAQYAAISAVKDAYMPGLQNGTADTDAVLSEMRARMNAAGQQQIIAEAQRQLNAYLAK